MSTNVTPKLRVAICGGGIGGLTLACALSREKDVTVDVYERAANFNTEIGAGMSIRHRNMPFLSALGLAEDIAAINGLPNETTGVVFSLYKANKAELKVISEVRPGAGVSAFVHRAKFHNILFRRVPQHVGMHCNKRLVSYLDSGGTDSPVRLNFADGTTATCDVLVGADGVKSAVRAAMYANLAGDTQDARKAEKLREAIPPRFSGAFVWRAIIPREKLTQIPADSSVWTSGKNYTGGGKALVTFPISQGHSLNVALQTFDYSLEDTSQPQPWVSEAQGEDLVPFLDGWADEPRKIVAGMSGLEVKKWVLNVVRPLDDWSIGRVTLLGDAAHGMVPFQGAGAGQAIEDATVLSALLTDRRVTCTNVQKALRVYCDVRLPIAMDIYNASHRSGQLMGDSSMSLEEIAAEYIKVGQGAWRRGSPEDDVQQALELFEKALAA
ncbi:FAD/NAD(P)-binding domain-containing protein [Peniophora sp. CONT]|nr:FAD/NAD(P)-binding domain-containing protein [Peniophora sp. CONT]